MSLFKIENRFLTLRPKINDHPDRMVIKNGFLPRLFTFFLFLRQVEIWFENEIVIVKETRFFLFKKTRMLAFSDLSHLDYTYHSIGTTWGITAAVFGRHDRVESFKITLVTRRKEKIAICTFRGEGAVASGWIGILFGDLIFDFCGTQEDDSRLFVTGLSNRMGIPIGEQYGFENCAVDCHDCGRRISKYSTTCLYCGSKIPVPEGPMG